MKSSDNICFTLFKRFSGKGAVYLMSGLDKSNSDYNDLISIACYFARKGKTVHILSAIHHKDTKYRDVYGSLIGTIYYRKCPDLLIDGEFYEYESYERPFKAKKISHMIKRGADQSDRIIIDNNKGASDRYIINMVLKRKTDKFFQKQIRELYVYEKGSVRRLYYKKAVGSLSSPRSTNP